MKATLVFDLPEETDEFECASKGVSYRAALWSISQDIFRPARKHGYSHPALHSLLEKEGVQEAISKLEEMFFHILDDHDIKL